MKIRIKEIGITFSELVAMLADLNYASELFGFERAEDTQYTKDELEKEFNAKLYTDAVCFEDCLAADLVHGKSIYVIDTEADHQFTLDINHINKGLKKMAEGCHPAFGRILREENDYLDYETVLQFALYGEEIYG